MAVPINGEGPGPSSLRLLRKRQSRAIRVRPLVAGSNERPMSLPHASISPKAYILVKARALLSGAKARVEKRAVCLVSLTGIRVAPDLDALRKFRTPTKYSVGRHAGDGVRYTLARTRPAKPIYACSGLIRMHRFQPPNCVHTVSMSDSQQPPNHVSVFLFALASELNLSIVATRTCVAQT